RVLEGQGVDHGREHPHVVGGDAVHALRAVRDAAEDVAPADHGRDLEAQVVDLVDLPGQVVREVPVDAEGLLFSEERLSRQLQEDALVGDGLPRARHAGVVSLKKPGRAPGDLSYSASGLAGPLSSPTLKRAKRRTTMFSLMIAIFSWTSWP